MFIGFFFSQIPRKSSPAVLSISHESPCIFHTYGLSLPVSTLLCCLLLCSVTSCASNRVNVTGILLILGSKSFIRRLWALHRFAIPIPTSEDTTHKQTHTHATWIRTHNALFRAPGHSTHLRPRSCVIGSHVMYVIMLIKRFCNAKYVWLCKTVLELCLEFKLTVSDVAVFLMV